jgi:hypothetical protein
VCTYNDSLTHQCNCAMNGEDISLAGLSESKSIRFWDNTRNERTTLCCQDTLRTVVELQVVLHGFDFRGLSGQEDLLLQKLDAYWQWAQEDPRVAVRTYTRKTTATTAA